MKKKKDVNFLKYENGFKFFMWEDIFSVFYRGYYIEILNYILFCMFCMIIYIGDYFFFLSFVYW